MSSSTRVNFFSWRIFLFVWHEFSFTSRDGARAGNYSMWKMDVPCVLDEVLFKFTENGCLRHKLHRPHSLSEMSQRVSFQISLIESLSESFCWSVYISVCTCVSLLPCVESRRVVVWRTAEISCRAQECSLSCPGSDEWTLHALDKIDKRLKVAISKSWGFATTVVGAFAHGNRARKRDGCTCHSNSRGG